MFRNWQAQITDEILTVQLDQLELLFQVEDHLLLSYKAEKSGSNQSRTKIIQYLTAETYIKLIPG